MQLNCLQNSFACKMNFGKALTGREEKDLSKTVQNALSALDVDDGVRIFKVFQTALPDEKNQHLGIGKLNSKAAIDYLKFMALYTASNAVKIYPAGKFPNEPRFKNYYCPYERFASVPGADNINFFKLCSDKYGNLLSKDDIKPYVLGDNPEDVNYEHELDLKEGADNKLIEIAYYNMNHNKTESSEKLKSEFIKYKENLKSDALDRLAIVPFIKESDPDLFKDFSNSIQKQNRYENYKKQYAEEIDIFKFASFLAVKNIQEAKDKLNAEGLELYGDCPIGFSKDETIAFPDAFYPENITPGWGFRAIKYNDILKSGTEANKLFKEKISWHLENFDGIRFDVGWQYFNPKFIKLDSNGNHSGYPLNIAEGAVIDFIEKTAKEIKGESYDTKKLMYECDAGPEDFSLYDWNSGKPVLRNVLKGRTPVITTVYEGLGWGSPIFHQNAGLKDFMIGTNNHDSTPLRMLAEDEVDDKGNAVVELEEIRKNNIEALSRNLNMDRDRLNNPKDFVNAKFAELFQAKNHFLFFNDVVGNKMRLDRESIDPENYRYKIKDDYEKRYHEALQNGYGFNLPEVLKTAMKARNLDIQNPEIYEKLEKYSNILKEKGALTKKEAEKQQNG